jgi:hypothetical protein
LRGAQAFPVQPEDVAVSLLLVRYETGALQDAEVLRNGGAAYREVGCNLADRPGLGSDAGIKDLAGTIEFMRTAKKKPLTGN